VRLVSDAPARVRARLMLPGTDGRTHYATIVSPVFYDPQGEKQNV